MAAPLVLEFQGRSLSFGLSKVDRTKLYGQVETEALDDAGRRCDLATLAPDGRTLVGAGGTATAWLDDEGRWLDKTSLQTVDVEGRPVEAVESSFKRTTPLEREAAPDDLLSHNIRSAYRLSLEDGVSDELEKELADGRIFTFPFSYRGGYSPDTAFLLRSAEGDVWLLLGKPTSIRFLGLENVAEPEDEATEEDAGEDEDEMDFGMM